MTLPSTGYATATVSNPSSALTDFTLMVDLSRMPASWWSEVDTSDGTKGRAAKDDGTELACDWINFDDSAETGWLRVNWLVTLASSGTQTLRIYPPVSGNSSNAASATYGQHNAYDSNWAGYWPDGGGVDRTSNGNDGTAQGGVSFGNATGQVGAATDYDASLDQYSDLGAKIDVTTPLSILLWADPDVLQNFDSFFAARNGSLYQYQFRVVSNRLNLLVSGGSADSGLSVSTGAWQFLAVSAPASSDWTFWVDGTTATTAAKSSSVAGGENTTIALGDKSTFDHLLDGAFNEVQCHFVARPTAWVDCEYDQTNDNATFWGTWTWNAASGGVAAFPFHRYYQMIGAA